MNYAESLNYEPQGIGLRWIVAGILSKKQTTKRVYKSKARFPAGAPKLRSAESIALWNTIGMSFAPMTKAEWMNKAGLHGHIERLLGSSAIGNMVKGHWVTCKRGLYAKRVK